MFDNNFKTLLRLALDEDLSVAGDVTSLAVFTVEYGTAVLKSKDSGILAGSEFFTAVFTQIDKECVVNFFKKDGDELLPGEDIAEVKGKVLSLLTGERTALNFISFLSGIASNTRKYVEASKSAGKAVILDTRKTLPGYRQLSKYAVLVGGGKNHRMGLYDMILIKDNHIDAAGSITKAVEKSRKTWGSRFRIEVECRNLQEVSEAMDSSVDVILLDHMDAKTCAKAVESAAAARKTVLFEASGNMDLEKVKEFSSTGIDYISVGKLTHSVTAFDFSLKIKKE